MILFGTWNKKSVEEKLAEANAELENDLARWKDIYENGCSDPFWSDGVNLNLKRNHILFDVGLIYELEHTPHQLSMFGPEGATVTSKDWLNDPRIPPKVSLDYMAKPRKVVYF